MALVGFSSVIGMEGPRSWCPTARSNRPTNPPAMSRRRVPGHRAPHVVLPDGRSKRWICFGGGFVLLHTSPAPDLRRWDEAFHARHVRLDIVDASQAQLAEAYPAELVLVRPDGIVAWTGKLTDPDIASIVETVLGIASRPPNKASHGADLDGARRC